VATGDPSNPLVVELPDEAATAALAEDVALALACGDVVALSGDLGSGKTTFARALLRALAGDSTLEVPSPTFTLVQAYEVPGFRVSHFDLYRLESQSEIDEIGLVSAIEESAVLVEWPEKVAERLPEDTVWVGFETLGNGRNVTISGSGPLAVRLRRSRSIRAFLNGAGWARAARQRIAGDASTRRFERVRSGSSSAVVMDWPAGSQLASGDRRARYRARDVSAFVAVGSALRAVGVSAPEIYAAEIGTGLLLMEDFGDESFLVAGAPDFDRYAAVVDMLAHIHTKPNPVSLPFDGGMHQLPKFGQRALLAETGNFLDWYAPIVLKRPLKDGAKHEFQQIWSEFADKLSAGERRWMLFDLQSANLFWLASRQGTSRVGVIDFQDMFIGPSAYDVASICLDARVTIPAEMEQALSDRYILARRRSDSAFDEVAFRSDYAICAASRIVKNLGAFARLIYAGKPKYINHITRSREYLARVLAAPVLSPLAVWYESNLAP
jgi:tRNA threonylcarbamoyl adenosine modification protein YjeE